MILGISLVVQELHKGPRLIFRYPEEGSNYFKHALNQPSEPVSEEKIPLTSKLTVESKNSRAYLLRKAYNQYFNLRLVVIFSCL
jgi:hypothetical protein